MPLSGALLKKGTYQDAPFPINESLNSSAFYTLYFEGIDFAEKLYADDTLLFGTFTPNINKYLKEIQIESDYYKHCSNNNLYVNQGKNRVFGQDVASQYTIDPIQPILKNDTRPIDVDELEPCEQTITCLLYTSPSPRD